MNRKSPDKATILSVPHGTQRPLWSVMIPTYNCAKYLRETIASVLSQDLGSDIMQIEVIDDCSNQDDPKAVVEELGRDRIEFYQQKENVGYITNFETCLQRARGKLIHLLHGDDCVKDGFYRQMQSAFEANPEIGAAFCRHLYIDERGHLLSISDLEQPESGIIKNWLHKIAAGQRLVTPSIVVRREVYEQLGGFDRRFCCAGEDWEMWVRIATCYPFWFEVEPLAAYRVKREGSLTGNTSYTGKIARDMRKATEIIESYLSEYMPNPLASQLTHQARKMYALWALEAAEQISIKKDFGAFMAQIQEVFRCSYSWTIIRSVVRLLLRKAVGLSLQVLQSSI
jgi:glycosyltransferase involved in cell wall biosynthesis